MLLTKLLEGITWEGEAPECEIVGLTADSRQLEPGWVYVCQKGQRFDGHDFAAKALELGAAAVVVDRDLGLPRQIRVEDTHAAYPLLCANFFGRPADSMKMIGVTGTNGKTTSVFLIKHLLTAAGHRTGLIGTVATLILVVGVYVFKFPNNFSFGGVTGMAVVLGAILPTSPGNLTFIINMLLLVLGFIFLGKGFGVKTVYVSVLTSVGLSFAERVFPMDGPLTGQPVLELIYAIVLPAFSSAILFNIGASGGGTDIVAMILKKYTKLNIGAALFLVDLGIVIASCLVFDAQTGLCSLCGLLAKSLVVDNVIESINLCKYFTIVCNDPEPICDFITKELNRSATVYQAEGAYQHNQKTVILTVMKRSQAVELRNFIRLNQPSAFIAITNSSEIIGKGFRGFN